MQQRKWYHRFWFNFLRSNYITAVWNWFLGLAGKAAEAVLTASVVYSCARLLPQLHTPIQVDNIVFIAQMVALDIGGLSLRKLANQARKDGNEAGAKLASTVSIALISIMIANVALSVVQSITPISAQAVAVVEGLLLIARAVMAVIYAHVIHSLRVDIDQQAPLPPALQPDYWPLVAMAAHLQSQFEAKLSELASNQKTALVGVVTEQRLAECFDVQVHKFNLVDLQMQRLLNEFQALQEVPECVAPEIDYQALAKAILPHLRANIEPAVRAIWEEKQSQIQVAPAPQQIEARARKIGGSRATKQVDSEPEKASAHGTPESRLEAAYNVFLTNQVLVSGRLLAREAHVNRTYASKWLSQREKGGSESTTDPAIEAVVSVVPEP